MKKVLLLAAVAALAASTVSAQAADVASPDPAGTNDLYFGTGNPNGDFTTAAGSNAVLGLRADIRGGSLIAPTIDSGTGLDNLYVVPAGQSGGGALWDFVYSVDVSQAGGSFAAYIANITVTGPGGSASFNPITQVPDNDAPNHTAELANGIAQNAENIVFGGGNPDALGVYTIDLTLNNNVNGVAGSLVAEDIIKVDVVATPLPSAANMGLGMLAVIGAAGMLRKKLRTA
jgi:hypothetical protein